MKKGALKKLKNTCLYQIIIISNNMINVMEKFKERPHNDRAVFGYSTA